tara:strand:- start:1268 stop:1855 length:588 start_codon:yes stop_codon:yes gene_type:complete
MAYLFTITNTTVVPVAEAYMISPFKEILARDSSAKKVVALQEFAYIEFMSSLKKSNPFAGYNSDVKEEKVVEKVFNGENYTPDKLVLEGIDFIYSLQTKHSPVYSLYLKSRKAVEGVKDFFDNVDVNERDDRGKPIHKAADILRSVNEVPKTLATLKDLEAKIQSEDLSISKNRGEVKVGMFADPRKVSNIKRKK